MNRATRRAFDQAVGALVEAYGQAGPFPDQEATPPLLVEEVRKCLEVSQQIDDTEESASPEEIDELGTHVLECLSDLGLWAYQLKLDDERAAIENAALHMAQWVAHHGGHIAVLEPVVNALARQANATQDPVVLAALFDIACSVISSAAPVFNDATDVAALQPWLTLHFNCAITATRTGQPDLMNTAYDLLETHLPRHCAAFYEEGLRESAKLTYDNQVQEIMRKRLAKWTHRP